MMVYFAQILEQSLLMCPLVLGIYVSFSVLKIADLSVDGSFVLGAATFAALIATGASTGVAMICAVMAGVISGVVCAVVQYRNKIDPLIAGILLQFILYSVSLMVMQRPNIGLLGRGNIFAIMTNVMPTFPTLYVRVFFLSIVVVIAVGITSALLSCRVGLWLKAFGNNQNLVALLGKNPEHLRLLGLATGSGLAAFSGCLTAQASGYADINMGFGQALIGIAMILIGRELLRFFTKVDVLHDVIRILFTFLGVALYFFLTNELIRFGLSPVYLKMAIGILLIIFLLLASQRSSGAQRVI